MNDNCFDLMPFQHGGKENVDAFFGEGSYNEIRRESGGTLIGLMNLAETMGMHSIAAAQMTDSMLVAWILHQRGAR